MNVDDYKEMEENTQEIVGITFKTVLEVPSVSKSVIKDYEKKGE